MHPHPKKPGPRSNESRRHFLRTGLAGGAFLAAFRFPIPEGASSAPSDQTAQAAFELEELSIAGLSEGLQTGRFTSRNLVEQYLARIAAIDKAGPALRSVLELNPDALTIAEDLDRERRERGPRGPLHGIPILIKDNIDTADKMATTAGSLALLGSKPPADSFVVRQLRSAGALILGKTNLSEWANIRSSHSVSGWSGRGRVVRNPYVLDRNCSGSSSGSGAAVAANLCAAAVGTETDGSIVSPSSINGIVGLKPTVGLVSRTGIIPISHSQDTAGPMARTVRDAALLLGAMAGVDPEDKTTAGSKGKSSADYVKFLDPDGLRGARIGVVRSYFGFHEGVDRLMNEAIDLLKKKGAEIVDPVKIPSFAKIGAPEEIVLQYELKADMNAYLARLGPSAPVHSLQEIIEFNEKNRERELQWFGQDIFLKAQARGALTDKEYTKALAECRKLARTEGIDAALKKHRLDALVAPTDSPAWPIDFVDGDHYLGGSSTAAAVAGYPSITVPAGFIMELPVGISFFSTAWSEPTLLRLAYAFEQATKFRKPPRFLPTAAIP